MIKTLKEAKEISGSVSRDNSKMGEDCTSMAFDAFACNTGSKLALVEGTSCNKCYAIRLQKFRPNVDKAWKRNQEIIERMIATDAIDEWVEGVVFQIAKANRPKHRWMDSGDLCSTLHLFAISEVAKATPDVIHYLPTKEYGYVNAFLDRFGDTELPTNLVVRMSTPKIDGAPMKGLISNQIKTSTVHKDKPYGFVCPASKQGNQCLDCKACWVADVANISYPLH